MLGEVAQSESDLTAVPHSAQWYILFLILFQETKIPINYHITVFVLTLHVSEPLAHTFAIVQFCGGTCLLDSSAAPGNTEFHMLLFGTIAALAFFLGCDLFGLAFFVVGSAFGDNRCRIVKVKRWSLGMVS